MRIRIGHTCIAQKLIATWRQQRACTAKLALSTYGPKYGRETATNRLFRKLYCTFHRGCRIPRTLSIAAIPEYVTSLIIPDVTANIRHRVFFRYADES